LDEVDLDEAIWSFWREFPDGAYAAMGDPE
jgi:hypothetical protein